MKHTLLYIIGFICMMIAASCSKRDNAESLVKDFINSNVEEPEKLSAIEFVRFDSTKHVSDSALQAMQQQLHAHFRGDIVYESSTAGRMLYYLRSKCIYSGDTLQYTFYIDEDISHVVSFK